MDITMIYQNQGSHILVKTNELVDDAEAKKRLLSLKVRIADANDFAGTCPRPIQMNKGSALKGGSLDWVGPGDLVKPFEEGHGKTVC